MLKNLSPLRTNILRTCATVPLLALLGGCNAIVLHPFGDVAAQQRDLLVISTLVMLLIIVPVIALTAVFAWRYRQSNTAAKYDPEWDHSTQLEVVIWAAPLFIVIFLGAITWMGTHILDPYRQITRVGPGQNLTVADSGALQVEAVSLDWKWLFIYPQLGIATVNELAAPVDRPVDFHITSGTVMNAFYVPALAGMIYAMPSMETRLHAVINHEGVFEGMSANYSGAGFSGMHFKFHGLSKDGFDAWVASVKASPQKLDRAAYIALETPSENDPVKYFGASDPGLYHAALNMCVEPGKMCMDDMARIDAKGGLGLAGINNVLPLVHDKYARRGAEPAEVAALCAVPPGGKLPDVALPVQGSRPSRILDPEAITGAGLPSPGILRLPVLTTVAVPGAAPSSL